VVLARQKGGYTFHDVPGYQPPTGNPTLEKRIPGSLDGRCAMNGHGRENGGGEAEENRL